MANRYDLLAQGQTPLVARIHEVSSARELAYQEEGEAAQSSAAATLPHPAPPPAHTRGAPQRDTDGMAEAGNALPFIGGIASYVPGRTISVERRLTLDEDLHLADHHFVHAPGVKPLAGCFPVVPMTVSLEIMAEAAACLVPGLGLTGFENVSAQRWIALEDTDALMLRIDARLEQAGPMRNSARAAVAVFVKGQAQPAISASVLLGKHYPLSLAFGFGELTGPACRTLDAAQVYAQRHLFHGPRFQCLTGSIVVGAKGAAAELLVRAPDDLFRSTRRPQMLTDPALLDTVGQLIAVWAMQQGRAAFPIGLAKLELYQPAPAPGTRVPVRIEITGNSLMMLTANVEIQDGSGGVWLRIADWKSWQFQWDQRLVDFRREPTRHLLSDASTLPVPGPVCQRLTKQRVAGFDLALLARHYLHMDEMASFFKKGSAPPRQMQWLLGRIAAKDAVRAWHARRCNSEQRLHPAAFAIESDARGQPVVSRWPDQRQAPPLVSIAHCENHAIAVAHGEPVGVDIERIAERGDDFFKAVSSESERVLFAAFAGNARQEWVTRLWCAKEVLGKLMGTGVDEAPQRFEAQSTGADGSLLMCHGGSGRQARVVTVRDGDFMLALGLGPEGGI
jgi:phosphopantetheinyl transferase